MQARETTSTLRPDPLRTDGSNAFARHSMAVRVPSIIGEVIVRNADYPGSIKSALEDLRHEIASNKRLRLFDAPAPDHDLWRRLFERYEGTSWLDTDWFFAEMLAYRWILAAARYWDTLRDPFLPFKEEEMASEVLWRLLGETLALDSPVEERLDACLRRMLWSNRIDLSLSSVASKGTAAAAEHLLADEIPETVKHLLERRPADVHVIMDNAGTEQAIDFVLADLLLSEGVAKRVMMHVKMQPVLVSDVIIADMYALLERMDEREGEIAALSKRVRQALGEGRLRFVPDFFWNTAGCWWELPPRLLEPLAHADLIIAKGDVNYRRITNDGLWPPGTSIGRALEGVELPILALRTLKSDTLVGVAADTCRRLDRHKGDSWRSSGDYGVAQFHRR